MRELNDFYQPNGPERCGVILADGTIKEVENIHPNPEMGFSMPREVLDAPDVVASWHTHPTTTANLSVADYFAFRAWPRLKHYVVSGTEIWCYQMAGDILVACHNPTNGNTLHDDDHSLWPPEDTLPA